MCFADWTLQSIKLFFCERRQQIGMRTSLANWIFDDERCTMDFALWTLQSIKLFWGTSTANWIFDYERCTIFAFWTLQFLFVRTSLANLIFYDERCTMDFALWALQSIKLFLGNFNSKLDV